MQFCADSDQSDLPALPLFLIRSQRPTNVTRPITSQVLLLGQLSSSDLGAKCNFDMRVV